MKFALIGNGRMGREIEALAAERGHEAVARLDSSSELLDGASWREALRGAEVAFEFTEPDAAAANVSGLIDAGVAVVCGTTGWEPDAALEAKARSASAPVVIAPNFSLGMNLFYRLVRDAARLVGGTLAYDPFIHEEHHRGKRDAPSGTARRLAEILCEADPSVTRIHAGSADGGVPVGALHVTSVRAGSIPGTHTVGWEGAFDAITLEHRARSRGVFAMGAVYAAEWILDASGTAGERLRGLQSFDALIDRRIRDGRDDGA